MHFSINIPHRKVVFQVRVEQTTGKKPSDLSLAVRRQEIHRQVEQDIKRSREHFSLLPRQ